MKTKIITTVLLAGIFAQAADYDIIQKDKNFDKKEIEIQVGDTVHFKNEEKDITHNVYSLSPKNSFELKTQPPGKSSPVVFKEEGVTDVECAIHPGMKLKINVKGKKK